MAALVTVYDRGDNVVGTYPLERVQKYVDQPWTRTVRTRKGAIVRIYFLEPQEAPACSEDGSTALGGQHYVFLEQIYLDSPNRVWTHKQARFMPPEMMQSVLISAGARIAFQPDLS